MMFEEQQKKDFANSVTLPSTPDDLPSFSDDCPTVDPAKIAEATNVINESVATQEFAKYLND